MQKINKLQRLLSQKHDLETEIIKEQKRQWRKTAEKMIKDYSVVKDYDNSCVVSSLRNMLESPSNFHINGWPRDTFVNLCRQNLIPVREKGHLEDCWHSYTGGVKPQPEA